MYVVKYSSEVSSKDLLDGTPMQQVQYHNSKWSRHILDKNTVIKLSYNIIIKQSQFIHPKTNKTWESM